MTTTRSCSERSRFASLYRAALKQKIPFGIITGIFFALTIALPYFIMLAYDAGPTPDPLNDYRNVRSFFSGVYIAGEGQSAPILVVMMLLALMGALMQSSFLHSKSRTDFYHSLPVKRPTLLAANALAFLTAVFAPFLAVYLLTMAAQLIRYGSILLGYAWYFQYIAIDLLSCLTAFAAVYAFTTFISVNVGTTFDSFALTGVLGFLPISMYGIVMGVWQSITYGANDVFTEYILWLSPFTFPFQRYIYNYNGRYDASIGALRWTILLFVIWLAITAAICAATVWCYNRRRSEIAEQTQPGGLFQTIAKCFAAFCGGTLFYAIFFRIGGIPSRLIASLIGALLIGLIAELILSRGVRAIVKNLKWLAAAGGLFCLVVICVQVDITGYVARVPNPEAVESVSVGYRGRFDELSDTNIHHQDYNGSTVLTSPDAIAVVTDMHRTAVDNRPTDNIFGGYYGDNNDYTYQWVRLEYKLKNGSTLSRSYNTLYTDAYRKLADLEDKDEFIQSNHAVFFIDEYADGNISAASLVNTVTVYNSIGGNGIPYSLSDADNARLLEAVRADMLAESLTEIQNPSESAFGYVEFQFWTRPLTENMQPEDRPRSMPEYLTGTVLLSREYEKTLTVMQTLGLTESLEQVVLVDEIQLYPASHTGGSQKVYPISPRNAPRLREWGYAGNTEELVTTADQTDIQAVMSVARNQLFMKNGGYEYDTFIVAYFYELEQIGAQLVPFENLPVSLQARVRELYMTEENAKYGYPIFAEEVAVGMMAAKPFVSLSISAS